MKMSRVRIGAVKRYKTNVSLSLSLSSLRPSSLPSPSPSTTLSSTINIEKKDSNIRSIIRKEKIKSSTTSKSESLTTAEFRKLHQVFY